MTNQTLKTQIKQYLNHVEKDLKTTEYKQNMLKHLVKFHDTQEKINLKFNTELIDNLVIFLENKKLSQNTIKQVISEIKRFLIYLKNNDIKTTFDNDYFKKIFRDRKKEVKEVKENDYFTSQELKTIIDSINNKDFKLFINLLVNSGLRLQEALNLTKKDFKIEKIGTKDILILDINEKYNKKRQVPLLLLNEVDKQNLIKFIKDKKNFSSINKQYFQLYLNRLSKKINIKITTHKLRETYAIYLLQKGLPIEEVLKILGYNNISTALKNYIDIISKNSHSKWSNFLNN